MGECMITIIRRRRFELKPIIFGKVAETFAKEGFELLTTMNIVCQMAREGCLELVFDLERRSRGNDIFYLSNHI